MSLSNGTLGPETMPLLTTAFDKAWECFLHSDDRRLDDLIKVRNDLAVCLVYRFQLGETDAVRLAREALAEFRRRELLSH